MTELTLGSLFSGSGGFELAGKLAGIKPRWNAEVEPFCIAVTRKNFPEVSPAEHARCHKSLNALVGANSNVAELLRVGTIYFDRDEGIYKCGKKA